MPRTGTHNTSTCFPTIIPSPIHLVTSHGQPLHVQDNTLPIRSQMDPEKQRLEIRELGSLDLVMHMTSRGPAIGEPILARNDEPSQPFPESAFDHDPFLEKGQIRPGVLINIDNSHVPYISSDHFLTWHRWHSVRRFSIVFNPPPLDRDDMIDLETFRRTTQHAPTTIPRHHPLPKPPRSSFRPAPGIVSRLGNRPILAVVTMPFPSDHEKVWVQGTATIPTLPVSHFRP